MTLRMVFCDDDGRIFDHPELLAAGSDGPEPVPLKRTDLISVPRGSDFMALPGRSPVGFDPRTGRRVVFSEWEGKPVQAVAVFMAPAFTQSHRTAYATRADAPALPLFAYTAMAYGEGDFYAAGVRVDDDGRQDPWRFDLAAVREGVENLPCGMEKNRIAQQLRKCALVYNCRAAQNFFLGRWEAPLPVSTACNSKCVGCLSLQEDGEFKAAHDRLSLPPTPEEVAEVALLHISRVENAVVSFGQGCEGEPLISGETLRQAIRLIRRKTGEGTINLNTNGSRPSVVEKLIDSGLDSIRVSVNTLRAPLYDAYYRPRGYDFTDVLRTVEIARRRGIFVSLNLLYFPGVTDTKHEIDAIIRFMDRYGVNLIQIRNLNIDPEFYISALPAGSLSEGFGVSEFMDALRQKFPDLRFGYFNPPKECFRGEKLT